MANILLVEANSFSPTDIGAAVDYARNTTGVVAVSMSFFISQEYSGESSFDSHFTTPAGHAGGAGLPGGVTFVAASGDTGVPAAYPATSPNVLSVGGTTLTLKSDGTWVSETGWSIGSDSPYCSSCASGGGISSIEPEPSYQSGVQTTGRRTVPDVAYGSDPSTGVAIYDSYTYGAATPWTMNAGTSAAAPQWAALIAIADQGLAAASKGSLDGPGQTLPQIYSLPGADFHDITSGNNGYSAGAGYDLVTGRGSPIANLVVNSLVAQNSGPPGVIGSPAAINYSVGSATYENVFLAGTDGNLYRDQFSPVAGSWSWASLGNPGGVRFAGSPAVINYSVGSATYENVFLAGNDGNLYRDQFSPVAGSWSWASLGNPGGATNASAGRTVAGLASVARTSTHQAPLRLPMALDLLARAIGIDSGEARIGEVASSDHTTADFGYDALDLVLADVGKAGRRSHPFRS
jgi:hypothetical protein